MKKIFLKSIILISILLAVLIGCWGFYAYHFNGGLSSEHLTWSQFGDFFNGVISPIFAAINIYLFWYLTSIIDQNNEGRQIEIQEQEDRRRLQDAEHQKAMILMQFRKAEIDKLENAIHDRLLIKESGQDINTFHNELLLASSFIMNFCETKLGIFGLDKKTEIGAQVFKLGSHLNDYREFFEPGHKKQLDRKKLRTLMDNIIDTKYGVITALQNITLGENT